MHHPILSNPKNLIYYFAIWLLMAAIHIMVLVVYSGVAVTPSIIDGLYFNISFALLAIPVWYVVRFGKSGRNNFFNILINHLVTLIIIILIWTGLGTFFLNSIFSDDEFYHAFLFTSIPWRIISGTFYYSIIVLIYYILVYYQNLQEKLSNEKKLMEAVKQAELDMLKSQINPHFLFNSLNSISSLTITNPEKAQEMIIKLSDFLRYSVSQPLDHMTTLKNEFENIRRYLDIEKVRFGRKLEYSNEVNVECSEMIVPALILQPLYENAVKHGVYESTSTIIIKTTCSLVDGVLLITIVNNFDQQARARKGAGIGLKNIRERLRLIYRNEQLIKTTIHDDIFEVKLFIPQIN